MTHNSRTNDSREIKQTVKHTIIPSLRVEHCMTTSQVMATLQEAERYSCVVHYHKARRSVYHFDPLSLLNLMVYMASCQMTLT